MSFIGPGQGDGYSEIPESNRKMASLLDEVLKTWHDRDEIKYQAPRQTNPSGSYYSDSQQPEGFLESSSQLLRQTLLILKHEPFTVMESMPRSKT